MSEKRASTRETQQWHNPCQKGGNWSVKREADEPPAEPQRREATLKHNGQTSFGPAAFQRAPSTPSRSFPLSSPAPTMMDGTELRWAKSWKNETCGNRLGRVHCIGFWFGLVLFCFVLLFFLPEERLFVEVNVDCVFWGL